MHSLNWKHPRKRTCDFLEICLKKYLENQCVPVAKLVEQAAIIRNRVHLTGTLHQMHFDLQAGKK